MIINFSYRRPKVIDLVLPIHVILICNKRCCKLFDNECQNIHTHLEIHILQRIITVFYPVFGKYIFVLKIK